jgi:hypothetical protein
MSRDKSSLSQMDNEQLAVQMASIDGHKVHMTGHIVDRIFDKNGKLIDVIEGHNLVVNSFLKLIMGLCKGDSGYGGIQYWAVGSGDSSWDKSLPNPEINATRLTSEIGRIKINPSEISYLTVDMEISQTPTNIIQIRHVFGPSECNGSWREFGIFGGDATSDANTGVMINKRHHGIITKTSDMTIERTMKFIIHLA